VDCSGYVTRVWGFSVCEKLGTTTIPDYSLLIPSTDNYQNELPLRMRVGDVFNSYGDHVVLLHYFRLETQPQAHYEPVYYESNWAAHQVVERLLGSWSAFDTDWCHWDNAGQVWLGYCPRRYDNIRDDFYLPRLSSGADGWNSKVFVRNNYPSYRKRVIQHTIYEEGGGDGLANAFQTDVRTTDGND
jgi:hypothetical protein